MIKIIADSSIYIKKKDADALKIRIVPMNYYFNDKSYLESFSDDNDGFEELFNSNEKLTTSHPNPTAFQAAFEEELSMGNTVICLTISSRLSGTYNSAVIAAKQTGRDDVFVVDSRLTAGGLYLLALEAQKMVECGEKATDIVDKLVALREKIPLVFSVDDMKPLRDSGRIGFVRMSVGTILNIKPILQCKDGVVVADSVARGTNETIKKLVDKIPEGAKSVVVNYISNSRVATTLYNVIQEKHPHIKIQLSKMGPVLGIHLGLQVVGIAFITP